LAFVDKNMNFHLNNVEVDDVEKFPQFVKKMKKNKKN
jgi:small nuclear ribonucleoprotein (snRNP)-like protein